MELSKQTIRGFQAAKAASVHSNSPRQSRRVGAALFQKSNLISVGFNTYGVTHPDGGRLNESVHAEHKAALKRLYSQNCGLVMYTYRELANGSPACSKPCNACQNILREAGISRVRYVTDAGKYEEMTI